MSQIYDSGGRKKDVGAASTDHGSLSGLLDDDHTQYVLVDGTRSMTGGLDVDTTTGTVRVPRMTTTERNALTPQDGDLIYNTTLALFQRRENGAWVDSTEFTALPLVTVGHPAGLTAERAITGSPSVLVTDNGANNDVVLEVDTVDGGFY